jgi:hypothetical protein
MRHLRIIAFLTLSGCGTLLDAVDAGGVDPGVDGAAGLACLSEDPCGCTPCSDVLQCALGLQCKTARRRGVDCVDGRRVCLP